MTDTTTLNADSDEIREIVKGTIDLYVHPSPELLPRTIDVVALAEQMKADGFASAMLWNQFSATAELATVVTEATGFQLYGSIILNGTVGGVNPRVVEHSLRMGARYVSMPSLSGSASVNSRTMMAAGYANEAIALAGHVPVLGDDGKLLPDVLEIIDLVKSHDAALGLGYLDVDEAYAVLDAARDRKLERIAILRPLAGLGFTADQLEYAMEIPGTVIQLPASSLRNSPEGRLSMLADMLEGPHPDTPLYADAIKKYGPHRVALTSDTGWNDATALQWVQLGAEALAQHGITGDELKTMLHDTPAELINVS